MAGISETNTTGPGGTAFTGAGGAPWLIAAMLAFLLVGTLALRAVPARSETAGDADRTV